MTSHEKARLIYTGLAAGMIIMFAAIYVGRMAAAEERKRHAPDRQLVKAAESMARAQWQQVYWLQRQAELMSTPCCMCE